MGLFKGKDFIDNRGLGEKRWKYSLNHILFGLNSLRKIMNNLRINNAFVLNDI